MKLFQTKIRFLGHDICQGTIRPIARAIEFADKFPDEIKDKTRLQRFLGCLNYVSEFFPNLRQLCEPLYKRLRKNSPPWTEEHTNIVKILKQKVKTLPCLGLPHPNAFLIVQTDASDIGYGGILQQKKFPSDSIEQIVRYHSGIWNETQKNYSTIKKEILSIILCISKFQEIYLIKNFFFA